MCVATACGAGDHGALAQVLQIAAPDTYACTPRTCILRIVHAPYVYVLYAMCYVHSPCSSCCTYQMCWPYMHGVLQYPMATVDRVRARGAIRRRVPAAIDSVLVKGRGPHQPTAPDVDPFLTTAQGTIVDIHAG